MDLPHRDRPESLTMLYSGVVQECPERPLILLVSHRLQRVDLGRATRGQIGRGETRNKKYE